MTTRLTILQGHALDRLRELPDESVNCCVTSPPYWGLRDYGTAEWVDGSADCDHLRPRLGGNGAASPINGLGSDRDESVGLQQYRRTCAKCGAFRVDFQLGLEPTPDLYVERMAEIFRDVHRVLRNDGTFWLNLGDSYASAWACKRRNVVGNGSPDADVDRGRMADGLKEKDLCGIPWRVAFALQADGWYLRSDIIWHKPNPMPESVTDRPTKSHEYIFLLTKSQRYSYDAAAIAEPLACASIERLAQPNLENQAGSNRVPGKTNGTMKAVYRKTGGNFSRNYAEAQPNHGAMALDRPEYANRNKRSVWTVTTQPYSEAHFATYPPDLIKPCILAGCPAGGTVLDPFAGSGTTGMVALELGRKAVLIELNPEYVKLIHKRCNVTPGLALA